LRSVAIRIVLVVFLSLAILGCATRHPLVGIAIEGVTVVDAVNGTRTGQRVVTRGDRIVWVGPMGGDGPAAKRVIDGRGRFLIPGLWDAHVHFLYDAELTDSMAALFIAYGVTSVRDTGGDLERLLEIRDAWEVAGSVAPRLFVSGPLLDGERVVYDGATAAQPELGTSVPDIEAARAKVRWLHSKGADFIKIYELVSPAVFDALVAEARALWMPIASHVPLSLTADVAGPQTGSMEHLRNLELACASNWRALLKERRARIEGFGDGRGYDLRRELHTSQRLPAIAAYDAERCREVLATLVQTMQVPTLRLNAFNRSRPDRIPEWQAALEALPVGVQQHWRRTVEELDVGGAREDMTFSDWSLFLVGEMVREGIPLAAGTDTPIRLAIPGESLHRELELLVRSGLTARDALFAATVAPARFFSLEDEMGQIAPGMRADLVLLGANPLDDIRHTRQIEGVMSQGRWLVREPE